MENRLPEEPSSYTGHTLWELQQKQSLPLSAKILMTKKRIKAWHEKYDGQVYIAFSGGKDSTVLKHIVQSMYPDVPAVFVNTGLEYPEVRRFAVTQDNVTVITPKMKFKEVIRKYGYPVVSKEQSQFIYQYRRSKSEKLRNMRLNGNEKGKYKISEKWKFLIDAPFEISYLCCDIMKKNPAKDYEKQTGRKPIIGTMTCESDLRQRNWMRYGCNAFNCKRPTSRPLSFWTEQDILQYIKEFNLEIPSVYGQIIQDEKGQYELTGLKRTGCMFCLFGVHRHSPNNFQIMEKTHPRLHKFCMEELGIKEVLEFMGLPWRNEPEQIEFKKV